MANEQTASTNRCKQRVFAAALSPALVASPLVALYVLDHAGRLQFAWWDFWEVVRTSLLMAYSLAAVSGPIAWLLLVWMKARPQASAIVPLFTLTSAIVGLISDHSLTTTLVGAVFGVLISIAYCLIAGESWRRREPEARPSPEPDQA